jgi:hypothetical protein
MAWYADPGTALALPEQVQDDTRAWRARADRILGWWDERLIADPSACIWTVDALNDFNAWLVAAGHNAWPKELFGSRFGGHSETVSNRVERARPKRDLDNMSRPGVQADGWHIPLKPLPKRPEVWLGVRFRADSDDLFDGADGAELRRLQLATWGNP